MLLLSLRSLEGTHKRVSSAQNTVLDLLSEHGACYVVGVSHGGFATRTVLKGDECNLVPLELPYLTL
jgi:hypothetical protein